jgi:hypothetical protein
MSAIVYALQMPECSSCGRFLGHLYDDHVELTKKLTLNIENDSVENDQYVGQVSGVDITDFISVYYTWLEKQTVKPEFTPLNIVSRAFLSLRPLTEAELPFGTSREEDGQRSVFDHPLCCLRMFQGNPVLRL